ncbi:signal peptidase II [Mucilaginibacter sp. CSA2-8R]|uniref:signal peptidase II n=1 Tax=Mucilaginibacter sp. CSA2-8R TaxID=3141542 RepID=UPI00315CCAB7
MKPQFKILLFCLIASCMISCDQVTKNIAKKHLIFASPVSYFHDLFRLEYAENTGAALSLGDNLPRTLNFLLLGILPLMMMIAILWYIFNNLKAINIFRLTALTLVFAGGIGNLIDRLFRDRHVIDFMNMGIGGLRTGIFNVADLCITTGVVMLAFSYSRTQRLPMQAKVE